ncbi:alpha/beta fold hydrolase [Promicromonospora aerolata]|uniref:Alpha/beta fold hydrolase n=1 Tax=Promicromonospora aerolata TaxID=195749 RepID=A0ABW4V428_9MICO
MTETLLDVPGARLCAETFGDPADPAILLIGGIASAMDWWHEDFCQALAAGDSPSGPGRFVIRYDHRDTGRSRTDPPGAPSYTGDDLAEDPVRLLDTLGLGRAHVVGVSMGGGIAQQTAIEHPDRVATLTLMSTSPLTGGPDLPAPTAEARALFDDPPPDPDWSDLDAVVRHLVEGERAFAGPGYDAAATLETARRVAERSIDPAAASNHFLVEGRTPEGALADVAVPTLVLHGEADPMFPPEHGAALAAAVPGARLVLLSGVGHQYPPRIAWGVVVPEILALTAPGAAPRTGPGGAGAPTTTASP